MRYQTKVLVVGGGPAGASTARFLAGNGTDVILLEKNLAFIKPCGGGLSINAFDECHIPKELIRREVRKIRIISPAGEPVDLDLKGDYLAIIERGEFDNALRKDAQKNGVQVIEGTFSHVTKKRKYVTEVKISEVTHEIESEYIVAADGVNSKVRTALGIKPSQSFFTASERIKGIDANVCEFWFGTSHAPRLYSWVFPISDGISIGTGGFEQGKVNTLFEVFRKKIGNPPNGDKKVYRIPIWKGDLYNKDKIFFVGDAAGHVLPLTYEGIYYAMKAGECAAEAIIEEKAVLYRKLWKSRFQKRFLLMEKLKDYFLKDDDSAEKLVAIHRRPDIQEASLRLWISKDRSKEGLLSYIKLFRKFLC